MTPEPALLTLRQALLLRLGLGLCLAGALLLLQLVQAIEKLLLGWWRRYWLVAIFFGTGLVDGCAVSVDIFRFLAACSFAVEQRPLLYCDLR